MSKKSIFRLVGGAAVIVTMIILFVVVVSKVRQPEDNSFMVTVDYTKTVKEMVIAGNYDWENNKREYEHIVSSTIEEMVPPYRYGCGYEDTISGMLEKMGREDKRYCESKDVISKDSPVTRQSGKVEGQLVYFSYPVSSDEVIEEMDKKGFRPAEFQELLAFGVQHPEEQKKYYIIALGSLFIDPWNNNLSVFELGGRVDPGSARYLSYGRFRSTFNQDYYRFLAVRN